MDIQIFLWIDEKELGLSQIELSEGICTQSNIKSIRSRSNPLPMKILTLLLQKTTYGHLGGYFHLAIKDSVINKKLDKIEFHIGKYGIWRSWRINS